MKIEISDEFFKTLCRALPAAGSTHSKSDAFVRILTLTQRPSAGDLAKTLAWDRTTAWRFLKGFATVQQKGGNVDEARAAFEDVFIEWLKGVINAAWPSIESKVNVLYHLHSNGDAETFKSLILGKSVTNDEIADVIGYLQKDVTDDLRGLFIELCNVISDELVK